MSRDMVFEDGIPRLDRRVGDHVIANQNNSTILLGRDRAGSVETGYGSLTSSNKGKGAGAIHLVAGRRGPDPVISDDAATVYLSAMTDPDAQAGTAAVGKTSKGVSAVTLRADCVRLVPRTDLKLVIGPSFLSVDGSAATLEAQTISMGKGAADAAVRGTTYRTAEDAFFNALSTLVGAILTYAGAIKSIVDPSNAATTALSTAVGVFQSALGTFLSAAATYLSQKNKLV